MSTITAEKEYDSTVAELVKRTGFSQSAFTMWIRAGQLDAKPVSGSYRLNEKEVLSFVANKKPRKKFSIHHTT